jgi:predicted metal-dependent hydrolase
VQEQEAARLVEQEATSIRANLDACLEAPPPALLQGIEEFNRGEFYACHDTLEELWMAETRPVRKLYQGILQIGVAFYHLESGRERAARFLLKRGSGYLVPFAPACMGIDVASLLAAAITCLEKAEELGPDRIGRFDWTLVPEIKQTSWKREST